MDEHAILNAVNDYFAERRMHDIHLFSRIIGLQVIPRVLTDGSILRYTFRQQGYRPMKLQIRHRPGYALPQVPADGKIAVEDLEIGVPGRWRPFESWVHLRLCSRQVPPYRLEQWWASNGLSFQYTNLPTELRWMIFEYIGGPKHDSKPKIRKRN